MSTQSTLLLSPCRMSSIGENREKGLERKGNKKKESDTSTLLLTQSKLYYGSFPLSHNRDRERSSWKNCLQSKDHAHLAPSDNCGNTTQRERQTPKWICISTSLACSLARHLLIFPPVWFGLTRAQPNSAIWLSHSLTRP